MKEVAPNVQRIINWRESFATLPDSHFFELIRMYLGEVHTPFNKPKLIEDLSAFLRKEEHRTTIVKLLDASDLQLICAVWYIPNATQEKLAQFFNARYSFAEVYERLLNLEERLLLYRHGDKKTGNIIISVNPMLEETLRPLIRRDVLIEPPVIAEESTVAPAPLTPELLAAFVSVLYTNADICKSDGSLKKRSATQLEALFPNRLPVLQRVTVAFINLLILKENDGTFELDRQRLTNFAELDEISQLALLCVSAHGRFSRSALTRQAQLLLDCAAGISEAGFSRSNLLRYAFLLSEKDGDVPGLAPLGVQGRFASLISFGMDIESSQNDGDAVQLLDRLLDDAVLLGLLDVRGTDSRGEQVFAQGAVLTAPARTSQQPTPRVLTIDASFTITLLPGLALKALLPLMRFLDLRQFDTAATFEINKKSVMRAFDEELTQEELVQLLTDNTAYDLPQNLLVSIEDWHTAYSAVTVYKGYILQVSEANVAVIERNRKLKQNLVAKLAPGIYLLDAESDADARIILRRTGMDTTGKIKGVSRKREALKFDRVQFTPKPLAASEERGAALSRDAAKTAHADAMRAALDTLNVTPEQKDGLLDRIQRKIVLDPVQLRGESVRLERLEAGGMDYAGKIHVIDSAITSNSMVELEFEHPAVATESDGGPVIYMGVPLALEKQGSDAFIRIELIPQHEEKLFSIGKARHVKRIRGSVLR